MKKEFEFEATYLEDGSEYKWRFTVPQDDENYALKYFKSTEDNIDKIQIVDIKRIPDIENRWSEIKDEFEQDLIDNAVDEIEKQLKNKNTIIVNIENLIKTNCEKYKYDSETYKGISTPMAEFLRYITNCNDEEHKERNEHYYKMIYGGSSKAVAFPVKRLNKFAQTLFDIFGSSSKPILYALPIIDNFEKEAVDFVNKIIERLEKKNFKVEKYVHYSTESDEFKRESQFDFKYGETRNEKIVPPFNVRYRDDKHVDVYGGISLKISI